MIENTNTNEPTVDSDNLAVDFTVTSNDVAEHATGKGGARETSEQRIARMKLFFAGDGKVLIPVGKLLARRQNSRTLAEHLIDGKKIPLSTINIQGKAYPLVDGFTIDLQAAKDNPRAALWLCPACTSAHGSDIRPSPGLSAKGLASNDWYYSPATKTLFVISDACFGSYVTALGFAKNIRMPKLQAEQSK